MSEGAKGVEWIEDRKKKRVGVKRETATQLLEDLVKRAKFINGSDAFLYWVRRLEVFGSYVNSSKSKLGDLDILVELVRRERDYDTYQKLAFQQACREAPPSWRYDFLKRLLWAELKVLRALKDRHAALSLHGHEEADDLKRRGAITCQLVFLDETIEQWQK